MRKMQRRIRVLLSVILLACLFSGCTLPNSNENTTIAVDETGGLTETIIEAQNEDNYTESELKHYITESVQQYNGEDGKAVQMESCSVKNGTVKIVMKYASCTDYAKYNGMDCFVGTISDGADAGYALDDVELLDADGNAADRSVIEERAGEWKLIVVSEPVYVRAPDKILYASSNVEVTGRLTAQVNSVEQDGTATEAVQDYASAADEFGYIIYK